MTNLSIGRHPKCAIVVDDPTVSRHHATIVEIAPGRYLLTDENSTSGSFVQEAAGWKRIFTARVAETDRIRLGGYETSVQTLLNKPPAAAPGVGTQAGRIERNPETGEIIVGRR